MCIYSYREKKKAQKKDGGKEDATKNGSVSNGMDISHAGENGDAVPDVEVSLLTFLGGACALTMAHVQGGCGPSFRQICYQNMRC